MATATLILLPSDRHLLCRIESICHDFDAAYPDQQGRNDRSAEIWEKALDTDIIATGVYFPRYKVTPGILTDADRQLLRRLECIAKAFDAKYPLQNGRMSTRAADWERALCDPTGSTHMLLPPSLK